MAGCESFVGERREFIFNVFIYLEPVQRSEDGCDKRRFRSFNHSTRKPVLDLLDTVYLRHIFQSCFIFLINTRKLLMVLCISLVFWGMPENPGPGIPGVVCGEVCGESEEVCGVLRFSWHSWSDLR